MPLPLLHVDVLIRTVKRIAHLPEAIVPTAALSAYFHSFNIALTFHTGDVLKSEPTLTQLSVDRLLDEHRPAAGHGAALLVVGTQFPKDSGTNGILLDAAGRGACEVFIESFQFEKGTAEQRFQIYVHEIGHLLNLTHRDMVKDFPSAMDQWDRRMTGTDKGAIWHKCHSVAPAAFRARIAHYMQHSAQPTPGLPLSMPSLQFLAEAPDEQRRPWGSQFRDTAAGALADRPRSDVALTLTLARSSIGQGEPLDFALQVAVGPHARELRLAGPLGVKFQTIQVAITGPSGATHLYQSRALACGGTALTLRAGSVVTKHCSMLSDHRKVLFDAPGQYHVQVRVAGLRQEAHAHVRVGAAAHPALASLAFQRFLVHGLPKSATRHWKTLDQLVADVRLPMALRSHLAELRLMKRPHAAKSHALYRALDPREIPARVRERIALETVATALHRLGSYSAELQCLMDAATQALTAAGAAQSGQLEHNA